MAGTFHNLKFHLVFSTKGRDRWLTEVLRPRVWEYLTGILKGEGAKVLAIGGVEDHVHILFGWRTDEAISVLVRNLKANSSKWIHQTFPELAEFRWQEGYAIFSVSESQVERVKHYIAGQKEHHRVKSFQEELVEFLKAHNMPYDERYLSD
ncbi:MAG TPA: IS200/IS605 family transposase [Verrucomicrobiales bacterium]|nr:IS200/IS605 family transposase [Verrucomicrobiales bacterium]